MSTATQQSMARLRTKMIRAAKTFPDYNFRNYFVRHVKDQFAEMERWTVEEQRRFLAQEGAEKLYEMRRMALVNRLFATTPVFLEKRASSHVTGVEQQTNEK
ncbi:putative iron-sulfur cluster assembly protein [Trypanosoma rangeli]|uniref:Putative iron-sulfur cluster assembly protein n=1 Tax=Trypanosoma rangeli TaxID=5698 RepID=A0A3S5IQY6_TRYRA|nr:putative iron-sulfur cluster assembly protein [Trypanosoma rangeli]RNF03203.1 putative iron-sulfur cluster assembly protein [Trypanosoma rangeli]|eukprot:RNF03203.1 putative iron-sulfur cluster assembly protein [Trypanosoma rangeli]